MPDLTDLHVLALIIIGFGALCAIGLLLFTLWAEPIEIDEERL